MITEEIALNGHSLQRLGECIIQLRREYIITPAIH